MIKPNCVLNTSKINLYFQKVKLFQFLAFLYQCCNLGCLYIDGTTVISFLWWVAVISNQLFLLHILKTFFNFFVFLTYYRCVQNLYDSFNSIWKQLICFSQCFLFNCIFKIKSVITCMDLCL